jgi:predicted HD phosphohydrolase
VAAKRYLCAVDPDYLKQLSPPSVLSLGLQGGPMTAEEVRAFREHPYGEAAAALRRFDRSDNQFRKPDASARDESRSALPTLTLRARLFRQPEG